MNLISTNYNATLSIEEGVTDYYYEAHDEITTDNVSNAIYVGDVDNLDSAYISQGKIVINTILNKYQTYTITGTGTATNQTNSSKAIKGANISLTAPKVGDKVEKITKNDGYGDYEAQSINPTVTTNEEGLTVNAYWVKGLEDLSEESFYGTFEENTYYYALIDFEAQDGYELDTLFPDGIRINGNAPDEVFAVYGGKWNHCIAKVKAEKNSDETKEDNVSSNVPKTGDKVVLWISIFLVSTIATFGMFKFFRKRD